MQLSPFFSTGNDNFLSSLLMSYHLLALRCSVEEVRFLTASQGSCFFLVVRQIFITCLYPERQFSVFIFETMV